MPYIVLFCVVTAIVSTTVLVWSAVRAKKASRKTTYTETSTWGKHATIAFVIFFILFTISGVIAGGTVLLPSS